MSNNAERHIIQIIPALPGVFARYSGDDNQDYREPIEMWALVEITEAGKVTRAVEGICPLGEGFASETCEQYDNFSHYER